ncbi:uroporphyrinogen-III C-methyltransferase [Pararhodospirillum photometricum]|uniref:uroporphyrinogen-III C-methyltransferase n=1 Tax=Pararhodospirillum photometricum DSM 122 TaxID=1150469 RepID=H6SQQ1_PARPM|nr:uroporphyrinogen-III C-methyltransferase [Pararhodospirillum photometricum]CCG07366.1 Uroporphyrinogen-III C-methyltransferase [Pararhodospirillum photometricum DSM 122]
MEHCLSLSRLSPVLPPLKPGWVWLVGAGPGDPGLLTLLAVHALAEADVVVHDALIDGRVLGLARPGATLIHAGKRGGQPSPSQPDISQRLVELARANLRVVRLKGGDPFIFGRGAEEAQVLAQAGVPFRVVPGVTAGIGGLAYAGIPATTRDTNAAVTFVTGHAASGDVPDALDWAALARLPVLVFYMAHKHLATIVGHLKAGGRSGDAPAAFLVDATTATQKVYRTTLDQAVADRDRLGVVPPALFVVGDVVPLADRLAWWTPPEPVGAEAWASPFLSHGAPGLDP